MKKKLLQLMGICSAVVMLAGCMGRTPDVIDDGLPPVFGSQESVTTTVSDSAVNLSQGGGGLENPGDPTEEEITAISKASIQIMAQAIKDDGQNNILYSPTSIMMALGMTENGAKGNTLSEMEQVVNGGLSVDEMNKVLAKISGKLTNADGVEWNVANSVWVRNTFGNPNKDFLNKAVSYYHSEVWSAPFDNGTKDDINGWVNNNTKGRIPVILDEIDPNAVMFLVNALSFDGEWMVEYEDTGIHENRTFNNLDGSKSDVTILSSEENRYFELGDGVGFVKNYKGGEFAFVGILPNEGVTPEDYLTALAASGKDFAKAVRESTSQEVYVNIPEFKTDYFRELKPLFEELGMKDAFDENNADLSGLFEPDANGNTEQLFIGRILHKTHIEVDRKGTRAAAATVVEVQRKGVVMMDEKPIITLDRPYVYAIVDNETGLPVFMGCQNNMD